VIEGLAIGALVAWALLASWRWLANARSLSRLERDVTRAEFRLAQIAGAEERAIDTADSLAAEVSNREDAIRSLTEELASIDPDRAASVVASELDRLLSKREAGIGTSPEPVRGATIPGETGRGAGG
jgi:hypothetical protein